MVPLYTNRPAPVFLNFYKLNSLGSECINLRNSNEIMYTQHQISNSIDTESYTMGVWAPFSNIYSAAMRMAISLSVTS